MAKDKAAPSKRIVQVYPYVDETGDVLYEVVRYEPKEFRCRVPLGGGKYKWSMEGVRKVLYRLDHVVEAFDQTVFVCEGEKDVDTLVRLGLMATCCQGSKNGWNPEFAKYLKNNRVAIMSDNDDPGREYASKVALSLDGVVKDWRVIQLPGEGDGFDVTNWVDAGGDVKQLAAIVNAEFEKDNPLAVPLFHMKNGKASKNGKPQTPAAGEPWRFEVVKLSTIKPEPVNWLWEPFWMDHTLNLLVGPPGVGKTFIACHLAASVSRGEAWPDGPGKAPLGDVVYLTTENNKAQVLVPRLQAAGADMERIHTWTRKVRRDRNGELVEEDVSLEDVEAMIHAIDSLPELRLVILDPVTAYIGEKEPNDNKEVRRILQETMRVAEEKNICVVMLSHIKKSMVAAINAAMGAAAWTQIPRVVNVQFKDPDYSENQRRCLVPIKNNEGGDMIGKRFRVVSAPGTQNRGCLSWDAEVEHRSADDILGELNAKAGNAGRQTSTEDARNRQQTQLFDVLDKMTPPGDGWVSVAKVRDALRFNGLKMKGVIWDACQDGILEERKADKKLPSGGVVEDGIHEIRRPKIDPAK